MIVIVDYKTANIGSIVNMFKRLGIIARTAETPAMLDGATKIILPGVGHFDACARALRGLGFEAALQDFVMVRGTPLLGICVGAQLLLEGSDEGDQRGLGWLAGRSLRFDSDRYPGLRVPHMGWNSVMPAGRHPLLVGFECGARFYFAHSFHLTPANEEEILARTTHGGVFASAIGKGIIQGVQFHPEKSHQFGLRLLKNFAEAGPLQTGTAPC
jgi:glutamine amidotransferase